MQNFQKFEEFEKSLKIKFKNKSLLKEALTHKSYLNENPHWPYGHNERLEYLGDAVLELIISEFLFNKFKDYSEGKLTTLRAALVNYKMVARAGKEIGLDKYILVSKGEAKDTLKAKEIIVANAFEALLGAIYLDKGYDVSYDFVKKYLIKYLDEVINLGLDKDPKSLLQEIIQEKTKITPSYRVLKEEGPDHQRTFYVAVFFNEEKIATGVGGSKQEAEINAAKNALEIINKKWTIEKK
jgi:ribonuclease-3